MQGRMRIWVLGLVGCIIVGIVAEPANGQTTTYSQCQSILQPCYESNSKLCCAALQKMKTSYSGCFCYYNITTINALRSYCGVSGQASCDTTSPATNPVTSPPPPPPPTAQSPAGPTCEQKMKACTPYYPDNDTSVALCCSAIANVYTTDHTCLCEYNQTQVTDFLVTYCNDITQITCTNQTSPSPTPATSAPPPITASPSPPPPTTPITTSPSPPPPPSPRPFQKNEATPASSPAPPPPPPPPPRNSSCQAGLTGTCSNAAALSKAWALSLLATSMAVALSFMARR